MKNPIGFSRVKFRHPFKLKGIEGEQLPGTYSVEVRDERTGWLKFLKVPSVSTWIRVRHFHGLNGAIQDFCVSSLDLASALRRDKSSRVTPPVTGEKTFIPDSETNPVPSKKPTNKQKARTK